MRERGEKKIAEIVANEPAPGVEAILKEASEESFIFRKGHHAVADVAGRENAVLAAQAAGTAAVIGDGDDGCEISDRALKSGMFVAAPHYVFLEPAKECGEARTAAKSHDAEAAGENVRSGGAFFHFQVYRILDGPFYRKVCGAAVQKFRTEDAHPPFRSDGKTDETDSPRKSQPAVPSFSG